MLTHHFDVQPLDEEVRRLGGVQELCVEFFGGSGRDHLVQGLARSGKARHLVAYRAANDPGVCACELEAGGETVGETRQAPTVGEVANR